MARGFYRRLSLRSSTGESQLTWTAAPVTVWLALAAGAALMWLPFGTLGTLNHHLVLWVNCGFLVYLAVHAVRLCRRYRQCPWIHPVGLMVTLYAARYGLGLFLIYYWDVLPWRSSRINPETMVIAGIKDNLANSCQLLLLGGLGFYLGLLAVSRIPYRLVPRLKWPENNSSLKSSIVLYIPILGVVFALMGRLPVLIQGLVNSLASSMYPMIFLVAFWRWSDGVKSKPRWTSLLVVLSGIAVIPGVRNGMRNSFLVPLLMILGGYIFSKRRLPRIGALVPAVLVVLVLGPMLTLYKEAMGAQRTTGEQISGMTAAAEVSSGLEELTVRDRVELFVATLLGRMTGTLPAIFATHYPNVQPFLAGRSFIVELQGFVPRLMWPDKPNISGELNEYSRQAGIVGQSDTTTSAVFDFVSEYYVNFGLAGLFVLSVVHGFYLRALFAYLHRAAPPSVAAAVFLTTIVTNTDWFGIVQTVAADVRGVSMSLLILFLLGYRSGRWRTENSRWIPQPRFSSASGAGVEYASFRFPTLR